jgi:hypothetical protein
MLFKNFYSRISFRRNCAALLLIASAGFSSVAMANTISESLAFRLNPGSQAEVLHFQPFDLSLGTLASIDISFDATRRYDWAIWNFSGKPSDIAYTTTLTGTTFSVDGTNFAFADPASSAGNTGTLAPVTLPAFLSEFSAGETQFLAGLDPTYPSAFHPASTLTDLAEQFSPVGFSGDLDLSYDSGVTQIIANNVLKSSLVDVFGSATLTYNYTVPDSSLGLLVPALLIGLLLAGRFRRTELWQTN